jgi:hypothetical protein
MLFKELITVYSENHIKPKNMLCGQHAELLVIEAGGIFSYHLALRE